MSRIGKKPVNLPDGVSATLDGRRIQIKGKKGELELTVSEEVSLGQEDGAIVVQPRDGSKRSRAMWGLYRSLVQNMVTGVSEGFSRDLEIVGVGYRAAVQGNSLSLQLGFSHDVVYPIPEGIEISCERPTAIRVSGIDRQRVGQVAAEIRRFRSPEPYKGKGVRYVDEYVFRKEGKKK